MPNETGSLNAITPLTVDVATAARMLGVSVYLIRVYVSSGRLKTTRLGRRVLVRMDSLQELAKHGAPKRTSPDFAVASATV